VTCGDVDVAMSQTIGKSFRPSQVRELKRFGSKVNKLGANFAIYQADGELVLLCSGGRFESDTERLRREALSVMQASETVSPGDAPPQDPVGAQSDTVLATVLRPASVINRQTRAVGAALVDLGEVSHSGENRECDQSPCGQQAALQEILDLIAENFHLSFKVEQQIEKISTELAQTYEELVLLHKLSTNMKLTEADSNFLQMACDSLTEIVLVEGIAILLEKTIDAEKKLVLAAGSGLIDIDDHIAVTLNCRLVSEINDGKEALLDSEVDTPFKYEWPGYIKNIIAVPLCGKEKADSHFAHRTQSGDSIIGLMVAINRLDKSDFDSTDVKLFNSVAGGCAVFIENGRLFNDLKELFIGSLKALTSSIDAKDQYTRGHSERVALISRWIAERVAEIDPLEQEQIHKIYLAGLLHDIGKIGIDEAVLRKQGRLTDQEMECIRRHPSIGAGILGAIKQMRDIVPGVLCHHERIDGQGYPSGLAGDQIPLVGKIVGLADSFDAMTSKRTYREAKSVEQAIAEIENGLGTQFDARIGKLFLNSEVYLLWDIIQNGTCEAYGNYDISKYGTAAVGVLIR
jgi:HD-GYP domain-containing protein (c-di-GMP phosphodiesterase class II)